VYSEYYQTINVKKGEQKRKHQKEDKNKISGVMDIEKEWQNKESQNN
jgi:hypothetical protein